MPPDDLIAIQSIIQATKGNSDRFAVTLRSSGIPHLSFSQVISVEFCPYGYYLQYVKQVVPEPEPTYMAKGKLLHGVIAASYAKAAAGLPIPVEEYYQLIDRQYPGSDHGRHLRNATTVHLQNLWQNCQVEAIEQPFVFRIDDHLPPIVGVIDLVLRKDGQLILVDHKTGRDFYPQDELQMAIYVEFVRQRYGEKNCLFYYDQYRWVNNLNRIRKPPFLRIPVPLHRTTWETARQRIRDGYWQIEKIRRDKRGAKLGACYRCPLQGVCWKA